MAGPGFLFGDRDLMFNDRYAHHHGVRVHFPQVVADEQGEESDDDSGYRSDDTASWDGLSEAYGFRWPPPHRHDPLFPQPSSRRSLVPVGIGQSGQFSFQQVHHHYHRYISNHRHEHHHHASGTVQHYHNHYHEHFDCQGNMRDEPCKCQNCNRNVTGDNDQEISSPTVGTMLALEDISHAPETVPTPFQIVPELLPEITEECASHLASCPQAKPEASLQEWVVSTALPLVRTTCWV